jgi:hypothetical protein
MGLTKYGDGSDWDVSGAKRSRSYFSPFVVSEMKTVICRGQKEKETGLIIKRNNIDDALTTLK